MALSDHQRSLLIGAARSTDGLVRGAARTVGVLHRRGLVEAPQHDGGQARAAITAAGRAAVAT